MDEQQDNNDNDSKKEPAVPWPPVQNWRAAPGSVAATTVHLGPLEQVHPDNPFRSWLHASSSSGGLQIKPAFMSQEPAAAAAAIGSVHQSTGSLRKIDNAANVNQKEAAHALKPSPGAKTTTNSYNTKNTLLGGSFSLPYHSRPLLVQPPGVVGQPLLLQHQDMAPNHEQKMKLANDVVHHALQLLPLSSKRAYWHALQVAPQLIQTESEPWRFLRATNFNANDAARRLAKYWETRHALFGDDRAFRPMQLNSETGALTRDDVVLLTAGSMAILPCRRGGNNNKNDSLLQPHGNSNNNSVVYLDRSRLLDSGPDSTSNKCCNARLRGAFYLFTLLAGIEKNQTEGVIVLVSLVTPRVLDIDYQFCTALVTMAATAWPIKVKDIYLVVCPPKSRKKSAVDQIITNIMELVAPFEFSNRVSVLTGDSPVAILEQLEPLGFCEESLPAATGGSWRFEEFSRWLCSAAHATSHTGRLAGTPPRLLDGSERQETSTQCHSFTTET
jgi:hypothetical protein